MGQLTSADLKFLDDFENCRIPRENWSHEAHVRMAWIQLSLANSFPAALEKIASGIRRYNDFVQAQGYHQTVTVAFARLIEVRRLAALASQNWEAFLAENSDLLAKKPPILHRYFSEERLRDPESGRRFLEPDKKPLPAYGVVRNASAADAERILSIYAPFIRDTPVSFEYTVPSVTEMAARIEELRSLAPWLVLEHEGEIAGYAYASKHRSREAYQWTVEVSAYVGEKYRRLGVAGLLYRRLFNELTNLGFHTALAGITLPNPASQAFHEGLGFTPIGIYRRVGYKLGEWRDVGWWQRPLGPQNALSAPSGPPRRPG